MKKILSLLIVLVFSLTSVIGVSSNAEVTTNGNAKINRLLAFGDSVVFGDSAAISNPMTGQKCGDQQFVNLIAQEYGLNYISSSTNTTTDGRWYRKYAKNGAIMKNEDYYNASYGSILNQVTNCPDTFVAAADTIIMDGGINDVSNAVGILKSNSGKPSGYTTYLSSMTYDEMVTFVDTLKNMTDEELATLLEENSVTKTLYTWQKIKSNIVDGYKAVLDTLLEKGFSGTIYMQNNLNPYAEGKDSDDSNKMVYYWDSMINYFITDSINTTIENYPDVDIKFVDLCSNVKNGSKYTGHSWSYGDNLHLTFEGNQAVYKYYSTFIDPDANTLDVGEDTLPSGISWKTLTTFDNGDLSRVTSGELVKLADLDGVIDLTSPTSTTYMLKTSEIAEIDLSGIDFSNVYGIRVKFTNAYAGEFFHVSFGSDSDKLLYYSTRNSKSNELPALSALGISSNAVIGDKNSPYITTIGKYSDIQKINSVSLTCGKSDDIVYVDAIQVYTALSQDEVDQLIKPLDPLKVTSTMQSGASIRLSDEVNGIRFTTKVDAAKIATLKATGAEVELGTLIAPADLLNGTELTFDCGVKFVDVKYQAVDSDNAIDWHKGVEGQIAASLVNIKTDNITRNFIGRGYVKVTKDGETIITYADYASSDVSNNTRSLAFVSYKLQQDSTTFGELTEAQQAIVSNWADKYLDEQGDDPFDFDKFN